MNVEWPVLSFDFFEKATGPRNWPVACTIITGTQARPLAPGCPLAHTRARLVRESTREGQTGRERTREKRGKGEPEAGSLIGSASLLYRLIHCLRYNLSGVAMAARICMAAVLTLMKVAWRAGSDGG
jgi:hypothetical protein